MRIKRLSAELAWICLGQLIVVLGGIFGVRLLTYKLSPSVYGDLAIGMTAVIVAQQIILGPLGQSFLRFFSSAYEDKTLNIYIKSIRFLLTKATVIILIIAVISIVGLYLTGNTNWVWLFALAFLYSLFSGYNIVLDCIQNAARQRKVVALHQGVGQWLHFFIPIGLIGLWGSYSSIVMFGYIVASLIILTSQLSFFRKKIIALFPATIEEVPRDTLKRYTKKILTYAWPFSSWALFAWAQFVSSRWALLSFAGAKDVGLYSILYQFGYYPLVAVSALALQSTTPVLFSRAGSGNDPARIVNTIRLNNFLILAAVIATIISVVFFRIFHKQFFLLLVAPEYRSVSYLLPLLVLSGGLFAIGQMINVTFFVKADTQALIYPKIITAILGILLNYLGAYFYGLVGVVAAGVAFSLMYLIWVFIMYFFSKKQYNRQGTTEWQQSG